VVGVDLPAGLRGFVSGPADFYGDAIDRAVVRAPDRAGDQSVVILDLIVTPALGGGEELLARTERGQEKCEKKCDREKTEGRELCERLLKKALLRELLLLRPLLRKAFL
jgi:hypothetical protein